MIHDDQVVRVNQVSSIPDENNITPEIFVGGNPFTVALFDSAGVTVTANLKVQFNNHNLLDPTKQHHSVNPINAAIQSSNQVLINAGVTFGGKITENSASASDFNDHWMDLPDASIDVAGGVSAYVGSASCRYIRIQYIPTAGLTALPSTFTAEVYHRGLAPRM